jgi:hypothetical protein
VNAPRYDDRGACLDCVALIGRSRCEFHAAEDQKRDARNRATLRRSCEIGHAHELARICARYELESDEGGTREQKAERILRR